MSAMIQKTNAYKSENIYQLNLAAWYINPVGFTSTAQIISDLMPYAENGVTNYIDNNTIVTAVALLPSMCDLDYYSIFNLHSIPIIKIYNV